MTVPTPGEQAPLGDALRAAWEAVESGDRARIAEAEHAFRALMPRAIAAAGEGGVPHASALRGLAAAVEAVGRHAEAAELFEVLAAVLDREVADESVGAREVRTDQLLQAMALAVTNSAAAERSTGGVAVAGDGTDPGGALPRIDGIIARAEAELGGTHGRTLWLLARRAQLHTRIRGAVGLPSFDLLIARAAAEEENGANHLTALAEKATELSRLDLDGDSALLWERVVEGRRLLFGFDHPETLSAWWWQARTLLWSGDAEGAEREFGLLIPALQRTLGDDAPGTLDAMRARVNVLQRLGRERLGEALEIARRIAVLEAARFGPESRQVLESRGKAVDLLDDLDRLDEAEAESAELCDEALAELGEAAQLPIVLGRTRQWILRRMRDAETDRDATESGAAAAQLAATGIALCDRLIDLAEARARSVGGDLANGDADPGDGLADRIRLFGQTLHDRANWHQAGSDESIAALASAIARVDAAGFADGIAEGTELRIALHDRIASELFSAERPDEALTHYTRSWELERELAVVPSRAGRAPERIAQSAKSVGSTLRRLGRTEEAEACFADALVAAAAGGVSDGTVAELRNVRALALQELGRTDEAALEMRALWEASGDPSDAVDLAVVYLAGDRPADAESLLRGVLAQLEASGTARTLTATRLMGNLALAACHQDRDAEAAAAYDRLLDVQRELFGDTHRDALTTRHNRALEELHLGRSAEAARRLEEVWRLRVEHLGERDPQTLSTLSNLAVAAREAGDLDRARETGQRALEASREVLGATHPATLRRTRELARTLELSGASSTERAELDDAVRAAVQQHGAGDAPTVATTLRYAEHLLQQDRPGDALIEFARARDASSVTGAGSHARPGAGEGTSGVSGSGALDRLAAERGIAACHRKLGSHREAAAAFAVVAAQTEQVLPNDRWAIVDALNEQSFALSKADRVDELVAPQRRAIALAEALGNDPRRALQLRVWLGRRLAGHARTEEALVEYRAAYELAVPELGRADALAVDAADDVAESLAKLGRSREALAIYRENIPLMERAFGVESRQVRRARAKQKEAATIVSRLPRIAGSVVLAMGIIWLVIWNTFG